MNRKICTALVVGCIYRPPDQPKDNFIDNFSESLSKIDSGFDKVVPGDFNIDFSVGRRNANSSQKRLLKEITELHDLKQVIESPTFVTEHSEFLMDLCFTNAQQKNYRVRRYRSWIERSFFGLLRNEERSLSSSTKHDSISLV